MACANYVGYVDHIETALVALSLVGVTRPACAVSRSPWIASACRAPAFRDARQSELRRHHHAPRNRNVERLANVVRNLKALADEHNPQPEPTLCELAGEIAGMQGAA